MGIGTTNPSVYKLEVNGAVASIGSTNQYLIARTGATSANAAVELVGASGTNADWLIGTNRGDIWGSADTLTFYKNAGTFGAKMVIQDNGNVGIGTTTPVAKLDVLGNVVFTGGGTFGYTASVGANNGLILGTGAKASTSSGGRGSIQINSNDASNPLQGWMTLFTDATGGNRRLAIGVVEQNVAWRNVTLAEAGGNVGIGTISPVSKLHVHGNYANDGTGGFTLDATDNGDPETYVLRINPFVLGAAKVGYQFQTKSAVGGTNVPLVFDNFGNVGIGTTNPADKLQVVTPATFGVSGTVVNSYPIARFTVASGAERGLEIGAPTGGVSSPVFLKVHGTSSRFALLNENDVEMLTALTTGNVGIGTTSPSHKLAVNGTIRAKEVIVDTGWADYVFKPGYQLTSLSEVEGVIKRDGHLPGIPSAAEVAEHGVSMGEMQAKLLAKLEEVTLHLIRMDKENTELRQRVQSLEASR